MELFRYNAVLKSRQVFGNLLCILSLILFALTSVTADLIDPIKFSQTLSTLAREGLGVSDLQAEFDRLQFTELQIDGLAVIPTLTASVESKFKERFNVVRKLKTTVEASYARLRRRNSQEECCRVKYSSQNLEYDSRYRQKVDLSSACLKVSGTASVNPRHLDDVALNEIKKSATDYPFIKWQYFGSEEGVLTNFPAFDDSVDCSSYDPRFRPFYVATATPEPNDVVLVIDTSGSMGSSNRMETAKEAAKTVLGTMNPRDRIGLVSFNSIASTPVGSEGRECFSSSLADATPINLDFLKSHVSTLFPGGGTDYGKAFSKAFDLFEGSSVGQSISRNKVIIFLTDGKPNDDERSIMQLIKYRNTQLHNSVIIMAYGMAVDARILRDIANQDGSSYGVTKAPDVTPGRFTNVIDTKNLRSAMATYYNFFSKNTVQDQPIVSIPYVDAFGLGLITSITLPCYYNGEFIGVVGTDISMEDLLSDITYFQKGQASYAFMADSSGRTMMHPLLPAPSEASDNPIFLDIRALEPEPGFTTVFESMRIGGSGQTTFVSKRFLPRGGNVKEGVTVIELSSTYYWRPVEETNFTVGLVVAVGDREEKLSQQPIPSGFKFLYHRLDLVKPVNPCIHFSRYAAKDTTVVKFGPEAFTDPYTYLGLDETKSRVDSFEAYMTGSSAANPGFKEGIRDTVVATRKVEDIWFRERTTLTQYLVWRYIGTANGVFRLTPGTSLAKSYDPRKRPWYHTALSNKGLVALSTPYIDAFGAGVVITAAHTVYRGEESQQHTTDDDVIGVMGADFPLSYFEKLLTDTYPNCKENKYACFIIDGAGFLIMHEDFLSADIKADTLEHVHITEKETGVAEDLLEKGYLLKKECRMFEEIKEERFYEVQLPPSGVDTLNSGLPCKRYQLSPVVRSNAYLGIVSRENFCSKSCLCSRNKMCSSVQGLTCQCPCSSKLSFHYCRNEFPASNVSICPVPATVKSSGEVVDPSTKGLEKCFDPQCNAKPDSGSCDGVVGCYWCVRDTNDAPLSNQYCADINTCYGGKEGTRAPGTGNVPINNDNEPQDEDNNDNEPQDEDNNDNEPQDEDKEDDKGGLHPGAITGIVLGCFLLLPLLYFIKVKCSSRKRAPSTTPPAVLPVQNPPVAYLPSQANAPYGVEPGISTPPTSVDFAPSVLPVQTPPVAYLPSQTKAPYGPEPGISMPPTSVDFAPPSYNQAMANAGYIGEKRVHASAPPYNPHY